MQPVSETAWWFEELRLPLLRYVCSFGLRRQDGEEVLQDVFVALFEHLRGGKPRDNMRGWLFRVAHNLGLRRRREGAVLVDIADLPPTIDPSPDPERRLSEQQRNTRLRAVFRALPEQDRRCLVLRAEGMRYRAIAETMGISLGAVAQSLSRSLERLARADER